MFFTTTSPTSPLIPKSTSTDKVRPEGMAVAQGGDHRLYPEISPSASKEGYDEPDWRLDMQKPVHLDEDKYKATGKYQW